LADRIYMELRQSEKSYLLRIVMFWEK